LREIGLEFNQLKERKPLLRLVNFVLIGQIPIQSQWYGLNMHYRFLVLAVNIGMQPVYVTWIIDKCVN